MADASTVVDTTKQDPDGEGKNGTQAADAAMREVLADRKALREEVRVLKEQKAQREAADQKAAQDKLLEDGKFKELLAAKEKELESLSDLKAKLAKYEESEKAQREADAKRKEELIAKLPEEERKLYADVPLKALEHVIAKMANVTTTSVTKPGAGSEGLYTREEVMKMTEAEVSKNLEKVNKSMASWQ